MERLGDTNDIGNYIKTRIDLSDMIEINENKAESIDFILEKTGLEIKNAFWNTATNEYFEYS